MIDVGMNIETNDIVLENNDYIVVDGAQRVAQQVKIALQLLRGEWFLDTRKGVPYFEDILVKSPNLKNIKAILRNTIASVQDVTSVNSINLVYNRASRTLGVEFSANSPYGIIERKEVLGYK